MILTSTHLGLPLSTTQVCTGSIFGVGAGRRLASMHWEVVGHIVLAWSFTLPAAAVVGAAAASAVTVVLLVAFALVGRSARSGRRVSDDGTTSGTRPDVGTAIAVLCMLAAGLIVCYGLYLIIA